MIRGALASRYGISPLGRGVIRPASGGWWLSGGIAAANCIAAYQPKGAADYAASLVNLANPGTYNAFAGADPTWDATDGWIGAGASWLRTGFSLAAGYSFIARYTNFAGGSISGGALSPPNYFGLNYYNSSNVIPYYGNTGTFAGNYFSGIAALCSVGATGFKFFRGTTLGINNTTTSAPTTYSEQCIMGWTGGSFKATVKLQAIAFYNIDISSYVNDLNTAMAAL